MNKLTTPERLETMLKLTEEAHAIREAALGHRDEEWALWYATYMLAHWPEHFQ